MLKLISVYLLSFLVLISSPVFGAEQLLPEKSPPEQSSTQEPGFFSMAGDLIIARPLLLVTTIVGGTMFVLSYPFSALGGNSEEAADVLFKTPAKATFYRCLGCSF